MKAVTFAIGLSLLLAGAVAGQSRDNYVDYYIVKVKPEKRADFDAIAKKIVDANRRAKGDTWLASETMYGDSNTITFASSRKDMAAIDSATDNFMRALKESMGPNFESVLAQMNACTISSRGEIRRRRWDLSRNVPDDQDGYSKVIGESRFTRIAAYRIRPGHGPHFEGLLKMVGEAVDKRSNTRSVIAVAQSMAGQNGAMYFVTRFAANLAGFEAPTTPLREILGDEAYEQYQKGLGEDVIATEVAINRFLPALSNPPETIVNVSKAFWMPENMMNSADRMAPTKTKAKK